MLFAALSNITKKYTRFGKRIDSKPGDEQEIRVSIAENTSKHISTSHFHEERHL